MSWSPDGTTIGLLNRSKLLTRQISSGNERTFDLPAAAVSSPLWVADGSAVIVTTLRVGESGVIYRVNVPSGDSQRLFALGPTQSRPFAVSRDGKTVYLGKRLESGRFGGIVAVDVVSGLERHVVSFPAVAQDTVAPAVSLSPDGRTFAIMVQPSGSQTEGRIFTVGVDGSGYRDIGAVPASGWTDLRWTPDGRSLLFPAFDAQRNWRIMRVELSSGKVSPDGLTFDLLGPLVPEIRVNPGNFSGLDVSPDGTRIVVSTLTLARSEIWTLDGLRWER